jgi:predicted methyltransferase
MGSDRGRQGEIKMGRASMFRTTIATLALLLASAAAPANHAAPAAAARPQADIDRDASRHPADLVKFTGARRGMTVVDFWPGGGYWTRLFSSTVGPSGKVIEFVPAEIAGAKSAPVDLARRTAAEPGLGNVTVQSATVDKLIDGHDFADIVWTFENYHDVHDSFMHGADVRAFDRAVFRMLKPGGIFVVADHADAAGAGLAHTEDLHRIDPAAVRAEVLSAGFVLDGESRVLANPADPHSAKVFDPSIRGNTDRFVLRFRKPRR